MVILWCVIQKTVGVHCDYCRGEELPQRLAPKLSADYVLQSNHKNKHLTKDACFIMKTLDYHFAMQLKSPSLSYSTQLG